MHAFRGNFELLLEKLKILDNKLMIIAPVEEELASCEKGRMNTLPH